MKLKKDGFTLIEMLIVIVIIGILAAIIIVNFNNASDKARKEGYNVSYAHLKYLYPFPANTGKVLSKFKKVLIPEINLGQLTKLIRSEFLRDVISLTKIKGLPFRSIEIHSKITEILGGGNGK